MQACVCCKIMGNRGTGYDWRTLIFTGHVVQNKVRDHVLNKISVYQAVALLLAIIKSVRIKLVCLMLYHFWVLDVRLGCSQLFLLKDV